jgi:hypothetical protein
MSKRDERTGTHAVESASGERAAGWSVLQMVVVALASVAGYHFLLGSTPAIASAQGRYEQIVVVDTERLVAGKIKQATQQIAGGAEYTPDQLQLQGKNFGAELLGALKKYRDGGYLVIDRRHALAIPLGVDVTDEIGTQLGLELEPASDPFSAPTLEE